MPLNTVDVEDVDRQDVREAGERRLHVLGFPSVVVLDDEDDLEVDDPLRRERGGRRRPSERGASMATRQGVPSTWRPPARSSPPSSKRKDSWPSLGRPRATTSTA